MTPSFLAALAILLLAPSFIFARAHGTTRTYRLARLSKDVRFAGFFPHDIQSTVVLTLPLALFLALSYLKLLFVLQLTNQTAIDELWSQLVPLATPGGWSFPPSMFWSALERAGWLYVGLVVFSWATGKISGFLRWNVWEFGFKTVPNEWFYLIRPVGDTRFVIVDVLTRVKRGENLPTIYRGIAAGWVMGNDGRPEALTLIEAMRIEVVNPTAKVLSERDFRKEYIPSKNFVIPYAEIQNINVAKVWKMKPNRPLSRLLWNLEPYVRTVMKSISTAASSQD